MAKTLVFGCSEGRRVKYSYYNLRDIPLLFCSHYYRVYFVLFCFCLLFFSFIFKFSFNIPFWLTFWLKWSCHVELCWDPSTDSVTVYSLHMWTKVHEQKSVWNKFASRPLLPFVLCFKISRLFSDILQFFIFFLRIQKLFLAWAWLAKAKGHSCHTKKSNLAKTFTEKNE